MLTAAPELLSAPLDPTALRPSLAGALLLLLLLGRAQQAAATGAEAVAAAVTSAVDACQLSRIAGESCCCLGC